MCCVKGPYLYKDMLIVKISWHRELACKDVKGPMFESTRSPRDEIGHHEVNEKLSSCHKCVLVGGQDL